MDAEVDADDIKLFIMAVFILFIIFLSALLLLIIICRRQKKRHQNWDRLHNNRQTTMIRNKLLINNNTKKNKHNNRDDFIRAETLNDFDLINSLEQILNDEQWDKSATNLMPHCLAILRNCHRLTEKLAHLTVNPIITKSSADRLINLAKLIPACVDEVIRSMYPPLDVRLLEARTAALVFSVGQLALLTQNICGDNNNELVWIEQEIEELDNLLTVLKKSIQLEDNSNRI